MSDELPEQMQVRREKVEWLRAQGIEPYPAGFPRTATIAQVRAAHVDLPPDTATGHQVGVVGRVVLARNSGKLCFATIRDGSAEIQVMISLDRLGAESLALWKSAIDLGDHVGVEGEVITSRSGELSVLAELVGTDRQVLAAPAGQAPGTHRPRVARAAALRRSDCELRRA